MPENQSNQITREIKRKSGNMMENFFELTITAANTANETLK